MGSYMSELTCAYVFEVDESIADAADVRKVKHATSSRSRRITLLAVVGKV